MNRGDGGVCIVGIGTDDERRAHTPDGVPIFGVGSATEAFERIARGDVVLLRSGCRVPPAWLEAPASRCPRERDHGDRHRVEMPGDAVCMYVRRGRSICSAADVHRPLLALATHPRLAKPAYAALKLGYRAFQRRR